MFFLMICRHRDNVAELRDRLRPAHREHVATGGGGPARVLTGSALRGQDDEAGIGNFGILEAASFDDAMAFAKNDPFNTGGVVDTIELTRVADTFQAQRIDPMTKLGGTP